jgi:hypothetical protein
MGKDLSIDERIIPTFNLGTKKQEEACAEFHCDRIRNIALCFKQDIIM